jgi:hypothetical protein
VKRLIRNKQSKRFFREDGAWLQSSDGATEFPSVRAAQQRCSDRQLDDVEILVVRQNGVTRLPSQPGAA